MSTAALSQVDSVRTEVSRQTGTLYGAQLVGTALNFAVTYLLAHLMGPDNFSLFTFCTVSVLTFTGLFFEFGLYAAGARLLALCRDKEREHELVGALLVLGLGLGLAMAATIAGAAPVIDRVYHFQVSPLLWACTPLVVFIPFQFLLELACQGNNRITSLASFRVLVPGLTLAAAVSVFVFGKLTPLSALLAVNAGSAAACLLTAVVLRPSFRNLRTHMGEIWDETRRFGFDVYVGRITAVASQKIDGVLIPYFLGYSPLGFYTIGKSAADALIINFSRALAVTRYRAFAQSHEVSRAVIVWNAALLAVAGIGVVALGPFALAVFLPKYLPSAALLLPFVVGSVLGGLLQPYNLFLAAHGRGGELRNISVCVGVVYLLALMLVIPWHGLHGAAWVLAAIAGLNLILHHRHYRRIQQERIVAGDIPLRVIVVNLSGDPKGADHWARTQAPLTEIRFIDKAKLREDSKRNWIRRLRQSPCDLFAIYCDRLEWQTLRTPMLIFGLLAGARTCVIVDAHGKTLRRPAWAVVAWELPHMALELFGGVFLVAASWALTRYLMLETGIKHGERRGEDEKTGFPSKTPQPSASNPQILFIRTTPTSGSQTGGATSHISGFIGGAAALGAKVRFLSNDMISGVHDEVSPITILEPSGFFTAHRILFELWNNLAFTIRAFDEIRKHRPDYIYQRYSRFNWTGVALSLSTGIPLLLEYNGSEVWIGKFWDDVSLLWLLEAFEMLNLNAAAAVFVVSEVERRNLLARRIPSEKIVVNPNGVNPGVFHPGCGGEAVRTSLGIQNRVVVGFVGTFGPWHGVEVIVRAAALVPDDSPLHFVLIGEGTVKSKAEELAVELGCAHRIVFTGRITHARVPAYLDVCDILVSPQTQPEDGGEFFGSPTKLFEYMAMEKAIVASRVGQMKQILTDGENALLFPPADAEAFAQVLQRLADDADLRKKLGANARRAAVERFTWTHNAKRVLDFARNL